MKAFRIVPTVFLYIIYLFISAQNVYADMIAPIPNGGPNFHTLSGIIFYGFVGVIIITVLVISLVVLLKIRKKNVNK